jgi:hypothetical protein
MPLKSDVRVDASKFAPEAIPEDIPRFNEHLINISGNGPQWFEV